MAAAGSVICRPATCCRVASRRCSMSAGAAECSAICCPTSSRYMWTARLRSAPSLIAAAASSSDSQPRERAARMVAFGEAALTFSSPRAVRHAAISRCRCRCDGVPARGRTSRTATPRRHARRAPPAPYAAAPRLPAGGSGSCRPDLLCRRSPSRGVTRPCGGAKVPAVSNRAEDSRRYSWRGSRRCPRGCRWRRYGRRHRRLRGRDR
jgi:hypothetical protein